VTLPVCEVLQTLNDLIVYFQQPDSELEHEEKQRQLRSLIKRQDLFKEEVECNSHMAYQIQDHTMDRLTFITIILGNANLGLTLHRSAKRIQQCH